MAASEGHEQAVVRNDMDKETTVPTGQSSQNKELASMFSAALAPFLGEIKELNSNVHTLLASQYESEEDGETASNENSGETPDDVDASLSAILQAANADQPLPKQLATGDEFLQEIAQELTVSEKTSPPIHEGLAGIFNALLTDKMSDDKLKARLDKYARPENLKGLRTPKVNPLIWSQLSPTMKTQDAKSQKSQNTMIGSVTAMVKDADLAVRNLSQDRVLITLLTDAIAMALQCHHEINHSRRVAMKKELNNDYVALCNPNAVEGTSEFLFGDLSKLAKDITEANKLTKKVRPPHHTSGRGDWYGGHSSYGANQGNRRFQPYQRGKSSAFLGKSRFSKQRKKKEGEASQRQ